MITTFSKFIYGTTITSANNLGDFKEGATSFIATLGNSPMTLGEIVVAVAAAFNMVGGQTYTVSINRTSGLVTISAASNFSLLLSSGISVGQSFWSILGFHQGADLTGSNTYTGSVQAGSTYLPQFLLQSYVGPNEYRKSIDPTVNRTATGRTELVSFGVDQMIEMDIQFITNLVMDGVVIKNNPNGLTQADAFLQDITNGKSRFEFVPDILNPGTFLKVVCDVTQGFNDGSGYKLQEQYMQNLPGVFNTGVILLRVVS